MAVGFPTKANWAAGDVLTASALDDLAGTVNLLQYSGYPYMAGKNAIINGAFDIWQRGTSSSTNLNYNSADRWWLYYGAGTCTVSQESTIVPSGARYAAKLTQSVATTTNLQWNQSIETPNAIPYAGQTVTLSGYVAASASTSIYITLNYSTATDVANTGSWTSLTPTTGANTVTVASTTYVRITASYVIPSTAKSLQIQMGTSSIASGTSIYFGNIQLELGTQATNFMRNGSTIQGELAACQRYYYRNQAPGGYAQLGGNGPAGTTSIIYMAYQTPIPLRVTPTSVDYGGDLRACDGVNYVTVTSVATSGGQNNCPILQVNSSAGFTTLRPYFLSAQATGNAYIGVSAEL
jgi:hypothetical protein